jgi:hypothetical protein
MAANHNDPRVDELQAIVDHLASVLHRTPQQMRGDGVASIEDYFDDAKAPQVAQTIKREVNQIAKWHDEGRQQHAQPATPKTQEQGVGYVPDSAVNVMSSKEENMADKKANAGAFFVTDRDEKGEPKKPEEQGVPRLAKKKKEAVPEDPAAAGAPPVPPVPPTPEAAAPAPAGNGKVNPIEYIPTEALIKVIEGMPKDEDFAQNKQKQDALIALTEILKTRPIMPPEQPEGQAQAAPAQAAPAPAAPPMPVAASKKKADYGDHAMGGDGSIGNAGIKSPSVNNDPITPDAGSNNPAPAKAKSEFGLGGLAVAGLEDEKTADDYRIHDFKVQDEGIVPQGKLPNMDEQEMLMHPEEDQHEMEAGMYKESVTPPGVSEELMHKLKAEYPGDKSKAYATAWSIHNKKESALKKLTAAAQELADVEAKIASGAAGGGWSFDIGEKGKVVEDGGRTPEVTEAHGMLDESPAKLDRPETVAPIKLNKQAADMTTGKAVKESERIGNDLKKMYLDAKSLTGVNDTRPVREAVESIFRAADMFDEATKALNKQNQQEESEAAAQEIKAKNKKSSFAGLALAAAE